MTFRACTMHSQADSASSPGQSTALAQAGTALLCILQSSLMRSCLTKKLWESVFATSASSQTTMQYAQVMPTFAQPAMRAPLLIKIMKLK